MDISYWIGVAAVKLYVLSPECQKTEKINQQDKSSSISTSGAPFTNLD